MKESSHPLNANAPGNPGTPTPRHPAGWRDESPIGGKHANDTLIEFLAELLKTPNSAVRILSGDRSRTKRIEIRGVTGQQIHALLVKES